MRLRYVLSALGVLALLGVASATLYLHTCVTRPGPLAAEADLVIPTGITPRGIAAKLAQAGVIENPTLFTLYVRLKGWAPKLQAGEYHFEAGDSLTEVAHKLAEGATQSRSITIPEGFTVHQVADRLEAIPTLTGTFKRPAEGHAFPDTYTFTFGTSRTILVAQMEKRMTDELAAAWATRTPNLPLKTPEDALILASIIQKEAASEAEMPKIAGVFINRLNKGMKLQSDPTVIYGAELDGRLRKKDLTEPHPFNTYVFAGLPPTPIANPGRAALHAAVQPETGGNMLYFVADPSRTMHIFSATYDEHQKHVQAYWKGIETERKATQKETR